MRTYEALLRISNCGHGKSIDAVLLRDELATMGKMEDVGVENIAKILDSVPLSTNVKYYAKIVREKYLLRRLIGACGDICEKAYDQCDTVEELIDMAQPGTGRQEQLYAETHRSARERQHLAGRRHRLAAASGGLLP